LGHLSLILLDTHVVVWLAVDEGKLSKAAAAAIRRARASDGIAVSDIVFWELAVLFSRGILRTQGTVRMTLEKLVDRTGVIVRSITPEIAIIAAEFPDDYPRDPADRIIGATALAEGLALVTRDEKIRASRIVETIW
jgi:PIN domain nuclease of toxin-antitoxin system